MDIETLKGKLDDGMFSELSGYVKDLEGRLEAAQKESSDGREKFKRTANERDQLKSIKAKLYEKFGLDDDADLDSLPEAKGQADAARQYEVKLKRAERERDDAKSLAADASGKYKATLQRAAISEALGGHEFIARDLVETYVGQRLTWEGDDLLFKGDDGRLMPIKDGVAGLAKSRPELLKPSGSGGAGVRQGNAGGNAGAKTMTRAAFEALAPAEQMASAKTGVTLV